MKIHRNPSGPDRAVKAEGQTVQGISLLVAGLVTLAAGQAQSAPTLDSIAYCNAVQNQVGFIRYPLGTIGAWSSTSGETADVITRAPRIPHPETGCCGWQ